MYRKPGQGCHIAVRWVKILPQGSHQCAMRLIRHYATVTLLPPALQYNLTGMNLERVYSPGKPGEGFEEARRTPQQISADGSKWCRTLCTAVTLTVTRLSVFQVGEGKQAFTSACEAVKGWKHMSLGWVETNRYDCSPHSKNLK